jgi:flagellar motor protein MotB
VNHGIDKKRLVDKGFGPTRPIESNATEEGRTSNRRVEFHIESSGDRSK